MAGTLRKLGKASHTCLKMPPPAANVSLGLMPCIMVATGFLIVLSSLWDLMLLNLIISPLGSPSSFRIAWFKVVLTEGVGKHLGICLCTACTNTLAMLLQPLELEQESSAKS